VDLEKFHWGSMDAARGEFGIESDRWVCVAVRRLMPRMGLDVLLDAWADVARTVDTPSQLLIVGDGPERDRLEAKARNNGLEGAVRFLGRVSDEQLVNCYRAANVSVVPSVGLEGFGLVVLESLASGTPVIASDTGGLPEVLRPLAVEQVVPAGEPRALAERLIAVARGESILPSATRCRQYAEGFSWSVAGDRHADLYASEMQRQAAKSTRGAQAFRLRKARVVVLGHTAQLSGGELAMSRLLPALTDVDAHVILGEDGPLVQLLWDRGVSVEVLPMLRRSRTMHKDEVRVRIAAVAPVLLSGAYVARVAHRLHQLQPDLVHTNTLKAALYGGVASRLVGTPCLWHIRDRIDPDYLPPSAVRLVRQSVQILPSHVIANSRTTLATLALSPGWGTVVPSPIDVRAAQPRIRREPLRVGMIGRIAPWKGQDLFLRAFARSFATGRETAVVIGAPLFGEEPFEKELHSLAYDLGLGGRVDFRGFRNDIAAELASLDVLVHASKTPEPFGQVVVEGMAAGLPVIAADAGGPAEIISPGVDGMLFEPGNVADLADHLCALSRSPDERRRLGQQAMRTAARYGAGAIGQQVQEVYRGMLEESRT